MELEQNLVTRFEPPHRLVLRQYESVIPAACYPYASAAAVEAQSIGKVYSRLCGTAAVFQRELQGLERCISVYAGNASEIVQVNTLPDFVQYAQYCATGGPGGTSSSEFAALSSLASALGVTLTEVTVTNTVVSFRTITQVPSTTSSASHSPTANSSSSTFHGPSANSSSSASDIPTPYAPPNHTGLIAGVVAGCVVAVALLVAFLAFIVRRRKQARLPKPDVPATEPENLKPQLHSDDLKPDRKELEGGGAWDNNRNRVAAELPAKIPAELPANEAVGPELESPVSRTTRTGTNETESSATLY